jgi:hypothetical protein
MKKNILLRGGMVIALALFFGVGSVHAATLITPSNMQGWGFMQETATGSGSIVSGPGGAGSLGAGSANLLVDSTGGVIIGKAAYLGTELSDITKLTYSTFRTSGGPALAVALQLNFDSDLTDTNTSWQGRLVYEPYHTQTVNTGVWQSWDTLNDAAGSGTGNWWFSNGTHATTSGCSMATPCTWAEVKTAFPNGGIHNTLGAVILKAGGGWSGGFDGNVDNLTVGVLGTDTTYDFDPNPVTPPGPTNKDQCKKDGWKTFTNPTFKNQGQCVSWVNHNQTSPVTTKTFTASNSSYYNGPTSSSPLYASGPFSVTWDTATNLVTGGYYTEQVPANTGTVYYNNITSGTVSGNTFNLNFTRTNPNTHAFSGTLTLSGNTLTGTIDGPYYFTATGVVTP